jgi:N-acetylglucosaminyl-diphospho-decaprenol L-rhamnosyltransferase
VASVDVVIVNWNAGGQLRRSLETLAGAAGASLARVVVVDNASADGSAEGLSFPALPLEIVRNARNDGFAAACNRGASRGRAGYLLFLNPDTELFEGSISTPVSLMEAREHDRTGVMGIRLVDARGDASRSCARFPTLGRCVSRALGLHRLSRRLFPGYVMAEWDHGSSREVDHVSGAFYLVRRAVFEELGGFDERFFVYLEDLDFSLRARRAGWRSWYAAEARAFHRGGGVSEQAKVRRLYYATSSRILYAFKQFATPQAVALLAVTVALEPLVRICSSLAAGRPREAAAAARAYALLYRSLPRVTRGMRIDE